MSISRAQLKYELLKLKYELNSCKKASDYLLCIESIKKISELLGQSYTLEKDKYYTHACRSCSNLQKEYMNEFKENKLFLSDFYYNLVNIYKNTFNNIKPSIQDDFFSKTEINKVLKVFLEHYCKNDLDYINYLIKNRTISISAPYYSGECQRLYKNSPIILINSENTIYDLQILIHECGHAIDEKTILSSKDFFKYICSSDFTEYNSRLLEKKFIKFGKELNLNSTERLDYNFNSITYRYLIIMYVYTMLPNDCFDEYGNIMFNQNDIEKLNLDSEILINFIISLNKNHCRNIHDMNKYGIGSILATLTYDSNDLMQEYIKNHKMSVFSKEIFKDLNLKYIEIEKQLKKELKNNIS